MSYREITINGQQIKLIPLGDCACGCGGKPTVPTKNNKINKRIKGQPLRYIHGHNSGPGELNPSWKGGRHNLKTGYVLVQNAKHPRANKDGYVLEHILIAEKALGKFLPEKTVVHHHSPTQLVVCQDTAYHNFIHQRKRAYESCGHAHWRKCKYCKQYDYPENLIIFKSAKYKTVNIFHRKCDSKYQRQRKLKKLLNNI